MPYIDKASQWELLVDRWNPASPGDLNFLLTQQAINYVVTHGLSYQTINDVLGALEGAKHEFYRRVAVPYEEEKRVLPDRDVYEELAR